MANNNNMRVLAWPPGSPSDQNPYVNMMYSASKHYNARIIPFSPLMYRVPEADIFHIQWPESIFEGRAGNNLAVAILKAWRIINTAKRLRKRGGVVVLTAHNLHPHAKMTRFKSAIWQKFHSALLGQVGLIVGLSRSSLDSFLAAHKKASDIETVVIEHPHYRDAYSRADRIDARRHFKFHDEKVVGLLGSLRPSKNVSDTVSVFRQVALQNERLLIAGGCDPTYEAVLRAAIDCDPHIIFIPYALSEEEIANAFAAIDVCLINQTGTLNSGTALLALSQNRPLIAPSVGALADLCDNFGDDWVKLFQPPLDGTQLREILDSILDVPPSIDEKLEEFSPIKLSAQLFQNFKRVLNKSF